MENLRIVTDYRFTLSANSICMSECSQWLGEGFGKPRTKQNKNLENNKTNGQLSDKAIKRLKKAVNWLVMASNRKSAFAAVDKNRFAFKINFVTLTIPPQENGIVDEKTFKELLNTWLTYHRKYSKLNNYVWKLEYHKDGRLHIHITTDCFIHHVLVRKSWNLILKRAGLLKLHFEKFNTYNPNSTDVHAVKKVKKLAAYISKYMAKNNKANPLFRGRVWGCSMKISKVLKNVVYICPTQIGNFMAPLIKSSAKIIEVKTEPNVFGKSYKIADIYLMDVKEWIQLQATPLGDIFKEMILFLRKETKRETEFQYTLGY